MPRRSASGRAACPPRAPESSTPETAEPAWFPGRVRTYGGASCGESGIPCLLAVRRRRGCNVLACARRHIVLDARVATGDVPAEHIAQGNGFDEPLQLVIVLRCALQAAAHLGHVVVLHAPPERIRHQV